MMTSEIDTVGELPGHEDVTGLLPAPGGGVRAECRCGANWDLSSNSCDTLTLENLIVLAAGIDANRKLAHSIPRVAGQNHAYGNLLEALRNVLGQITGDGSSSDLLYKLIVQEGASVDEALSWLDRNPL